MLNTKYYNDFFELGQQKINFSFLELSLPDDDPVYTLKKVMENIDYSGLLAQYSTKGRTGFNPIMMYATVVYAVMRGIRSVDTIVDLCKRDLAFIWLTQGKQPKRDAFYEFKNLRLTEEVLEDLHYQFVHRLEKEGLVTLKELYIDGTKLEANAKSTTDMTRKYVEDLNKSIQSVELDMENAAKELGKASEGLNNQMERKVKDTFDIFDRGLSDIARCLSGTIGEVDSTTKRVPKVVAEAYDAMGKSFEEMQSEMQTMLHILAQVKESVPAVTTVKNEE